MPDPVLILQAFALAAGLGAVAAILTCRPRSQPHQRLASAGGAVGVGAGLLAGAWALHLAPHYPPGEDQDRFLLVLLPAAVLVEAAAVFVGRAAWAIRAVVAAGAAPVLLHGSIYLTDVAGPGTREWPPALALQILVGLAVSLFAGWVVLSRLAGRVPGAAVPLALALVCAGAGVVIMLSGYATGGQFGFPLAGGLVGVAVVAALAGRASPRGAVGVGVVGLFALLVTSRFFAGLTTTNATLLFAAPVLAWIPELPWVRRLGPRARGCLRVVLVAVPVVIALSLAREKFAADSVRPSETQPGSPEPSLQDYLDFGK
ncbi:MAG: hypothetical protein JWO38_6021 [Gemmataceae bacterium]|nr:hypothetical protein [Gemmataceae bacterium]